MDKFRVNTNGERDVRAMAEENPEVENSSRRVIMSHHQLQSCPFQPDNHRVEEQRFGFPSRTSADLQTLESSFARLAFSDSSPVRPNGNPILHNRYNQVINGGGGYRFPPPRESDSQQQMYHFQGLSSQKDCVNGSYGYDGNAAGKVHSNGFLNGNLRDFPYPSRNRLLDQTTWDFSNGGLGSAAINDSWRNDGGFSYNPHDPLPSLLDNERGSILSLSKDRLLSKHLLDRIVGSSRETFDVIFNDLILHVCELMVDPFAKDVVKLLMDKCTSEQITQIVDMVTMDPFRFVHICFDPLGSRAIVLLFGHIRGRAEDQISRIVGEISRVALQLARNNNAKAVIVECFSTFPISQCRNLLNVIAQNCYWIAIDQHGCCMLQNCLQLKRDELRQCLIYQIIANVLKLCLNCYGNYVVQYVVELESRDIIELLVKQLVGSYPYLSRNKYGSHAVQKLLKIKDINSYVIVSDLIREIDTLLLDPYGNYVIQTAWFVSKDDTRCVLRMCIERNIRLMRCNKFGKKILEKLNL